MFTDFAISAGATAVLEITLDSTSLVGVETLWRVTRSQGAAEVVLEKSGPDGGVEHVDPATGSYKVHLDPEDTARMQGSYYHELRVRDDAGAEAPGASGRLFVRPSVTQTDWL